MSALTEVTSFYVGYYRPKASLVLPYSFDAGHTTGGNIQHFGPHGLASWVQTSGRPYRWQEDQGALIRRGESFGDGRPTKDALVVPLLDVQDQAVLGLMAFLSCEEDAFPDDLVPVAEWLAQALCAAVARDEDEAHDLDLYTLYPELDSRAVAGSDDILVRSEEHLRDMRNGLRRIIDGLHADRPAQALAQAVESLEVCERAITDLAHSYASSPVEESDPLGPLTDREREIALLISAEGLTNAALAHRLAISERTVKGHVTSILRKLDVPQRSGIGWVLKTQAPRGG